MKDPKLTRAGVEGYNKPRRLRNDPGGKSHIVVAKKDGETKTIKFGQAGVSGDKTDTARRRSFRARHRRNINKGMMSAAYWANRVKWT